MLVSGIATNATIDIKAVMFLALLVVVVCIGVVVSNSFTQYKKTIYLFKGSTTIILMSIIAPIIDNYIDKSLKSSRANKQVSQKEMHELVNKVYETVQRLTTVNQEQKELLTKDMIQALIEPYYKQIVYQIISIEKYYEDKYKKEGD